jgi:1-acyl-sn-glycerol-3-phosphate acyltransferase
MTSVFGTRDTLAPRPEDAARSAFATQSGALSLPSRHVATPAYTLVGALSWPLMHGVFRLQAKGLDNIPEGGAVLAANHVSNFDPWPLGFPLWPGRQLFFMAKVELFNPVLGPILRGAGAFPVRRGEHDLQAIESAVRLCREGKLVAMFPEGTRREKGLRKKFTSRPRGGSARIALAAGVPLVPAAIKGTERLRTLPRLQISYGKPIPLDDLSGLPPKDASETATQRLMAEIQALYEDL